MMDNVPGAAQNPPSITVRQPLNVMQVPLQLPLLQYAMLVVAMKQAVLGTVRQVAPPW